MMKRAVYTLTCCTFVPFIYTRDVQEPQQAPPAEKTFAETRTKQSLSFEGAIEKVIVSGSPLTKEEMRYFNTKQRNELRNIFEIQKTSSIASYKHLSAALRTEATKVAVLVAVMLVPWIILTPTSTLRLIVCGAASIGIFSFYSELVELPSWSQLSNLKREIKKLRRQAEALHISIAYLEDAKPTEFIIY